MYSIKMLNVMLTRKYALFEKETKRTDFFLTPFTTLKPRTKVALGKKLKNKFSESKYHVLGY